MRPIAIRLACLVLCLVMTAPIAQADPELVWRRQDVGRKILAPVIAPSKGVALAIIEHSVDSPAFPASSDDFDVASVAAFDLTTGETRHAVIPDIAGDSYPASLHDLVVGEDVFVVLAADEKGGDTRSYYAFAYDLDSFELRYTIKLPLADYPDHIPLEQEGVMQISENHLLIATALRWTFEDRDPLMMVYDLGTGQLQRVLGLQDLDPKAEPGWFGRRPQAPDVMFDAAVAEGGILFAPDYGDQQKDEGRLLSYDLSRAEALPEQHIAQQDDRNAFLIGADAERIYFSTHNDRGGLEPIKPQHVMWQSDLIGVPRQAGAMVRYADPFPVKGQMPTKSELTYAEMTTGALLFTGSGFPREMRRSGGYLVATAPSAPLTEVGAMVLTVFDAASGKQLGIMAPRDPQTEFFGSAFDLKDDLVLVPILKGQAFMSYGLHDLALFRLRAP